MKETVCSTLMCRVSGLWRVVVAQSVLLAGACWVWLIGVGDRVYFFGKDGITTVLKTGTKFEHLADNRLWMAEAKKPEPQPPAERQPGGGMLGALDPVVYGAAVLHGSIYLRTGTTLHCIRQTP